MSTDSEKRKEMVVLCRLVQQKNLVFGSGGNLSFRLNERILITPSGRSMEFLQEGDLVAVKMDGSYSGAEKPSSEFRMHLNCYCARDDVKVILHLHSPYATAVSCLKFLNMSCAIPIFTPGYGKRVGALPAIAYLRPGSRRLAEQVRDTIAERNSVLLQNHGVVVVGKTVEQALGLAEEIEEEARMYLLLGGDGSALSDSAVKDLVNYGTGSNKESSDERPAVGD